MPKRIRYPLVALTASAGAFIAASLATAPASAHEILEACETATVTKAEAKQVARELMRELGYSPSGATSFTYRIRGAECANGRWRVSLIFGPHKYRQKPGVVLVDCHTGRIEEA